MKSLYVKKFALLFLLAASICIVAGCGSSGSTSSAPESSGTGSIAAKLVWSKTTAKTLYAAPAGVTTIKVTVSGVGITPNIVTDFFPTLGVDGSGRIDGIPAGIGRTVKFQGLDSFGILTYEGSATVDIVAGQTTPVTVAMAPITTASLPGGAYTAPQSVTLTASVVSATIYYTTNGTDPTTTPSPTNISGPTPIENILIFGGTTLKFFAVDLSGARETVKFVRYSTPRPP